MIDQGQRLITDWSMMARSLADDWGPATSFKRTGGSWRGWHHGVSGKLHYQALVDEETLGSNSVDRFRSEDHATGDATGDD